MSDVMTFIVNPEAAETDPDGRLVSLGEWSEAIARQKAAEEGMEWKGPEGADLERLTIEEERALIQALARYPEIVETAARAVEPQHIANYLMDLAQTFNAYFTRGTRDKSLRFVVPGDPALSQARLSLIAALKTVLSNALELIGVSAPEKM